MAKVRITIKHTESAVINIGDMPVELVRRLLVNNKGEFPNTDYSLGDLNSDWETDDVSVEEVS